MIPFALAQGLLWLIGVAYIRAFGISKGEQPDWVAIALWQPVLLIYAVLRAKERLERWARD
jgi:hypothetical protein